LCKIFFVTRFLLYSNLCLAGKLDSAQGSSASPFLNNVDEYKENFEKAEVSVLFYDL